MGEFMYGGDGFLVEVGVVWDGYRMGMSKAVRKIRGKGRRIRVAMES